MAKLQSGVKHFGPIFCYNRNVFFKPWESCAADMYLFKVNNGIARKSCDICSKLTVKRRH